MVTHKSFPLISNQSYSFYGYQATKKSLRLMMFQVFFLRFIARKVAALPTPSASTSAHALKPSVTACESERLRGQGDKDVDLGPDSSISVSVGDVDNLGEMEMQGHTQSNSQSQSQSHVLKVYNSSLGRPTAAMHSSMTEEYSAIMAVSDYEDFFLRANLSYSPSQLTVMLRNAVRRSVRRGYTKGLSLKSLGGQELEVVTKQVSPEHGTVPLLDGERQDTWSRTWEMYKSEEERGCYTASKIAALSTVVSNNRKQFRQQQNKYNQQQQQQYQYQQSQQSQSGRSVDTAHRRHVHTLSSKATNNLNYMQRSDRHYHNRHASDISGSHNQKYNHLAGGGNTVRHPYKGASTSDNSSNITNNNSNGHGNSAVSSGGSTSNNDAHNSNNNNDNNIGNNGSYNYSSSSHSRNRPTHVKSVMQRAEIKRAHGSSNSLSGLLASSSRVAALGAGQALKNFSGGSASSSNNNNNNNNNNSNSHSNGYSMNSQSYNSSNHVSNVNANNMNTNNTHNNSNISNNGGSSNNSNAGKARQRVTHKNSTMNNAMSVSGDRVRLHVFYQVCALERR